MPIKKDAEAKQVLVKRILWCAFISGLLASFIFLVAMTTTGWMSMTIPNGVFRKASRSYLSVKFFGLWRTCLVELDNSTTPFIQREYCRMLKFFPSKEAIDNDDEIDHGSLDYSRSVAAFGVISLLLSAIPNFFTWYSIEEPRYMFKRLAGSLHLISAGCIVVCIEVFKHSLEYQRQNLSDRYPAAAQIRFGYSMYLAWISFVIFVVVGITMFVLSAKKKGRKAGSAKEAIENEPVIIGRI